MQGILTGQDAVRVLAKHSFPGVVTIEQVTRDLTTTTPGCSAIDALRPMHKRGFRHLPVVKDGIVAPHLK